MMPRFAGKGVRAIAIESILRVFKKIVTVFAMTITLLVFPGASASKVSAATEQRPRIRDISQVIPVLMADLKQIVISYLNIINIWEASSERHVLPYAAIWNMEGVNDTVRITASVGPPNWTSDYLYRVGAGEPQLLNAVAQEASPVTVDMFVDHNGICNVRTNEVSPLIDWKRWAPYCKQTERESLSSGWRKHILLNNNTLLYRVDWTGNQRPIINAINLCKPEIIKRIFLLDSFIEYACWLSNGSMILLSGDGNGWKYGTVDSQVHEFTISQLIRSDRKVNSLVALGDKFVALAPSGELICSDGVKHKKIMSNVAGIFALSGNKIGIQKRDSVGSVSIYGDDKLKQCEQTLNCPFVKQEKEVAKDKKTKHEISLRSLVQLSPSCLVTGYSNGGIQVWDSVAYNAMPHEPFVVKPMPVISSISGK